MNRSILRMCAGLSLIALTAVLAVSVGGCASNDEAVKASGEKRTVRQAEPLSDVRQHPPTVTGNPR